MNIHDRMQPRPETAAPPAEPGGAPSPALEDGRVVEALEEYLAAIEAGEKPDRQAFLAQHEGIAAALAECLDGVEALHGIDSSGNQPAVGATQAGTSAEFQPGAPLGDFRIGREIGRGGM